MFYLNSTPNKRGERLIFLKFNYRTRSAKIYLPVSIHPDNWDYDKQRAKSKFKLSDSYNRLIAKYEATVKSVYAELLIDGVPQVETLIQEVKKRMDPPKIKTVYQFAKALAESNKYKNNRTKQAFDQVVQRIKEFNEELTFDQITVDLMHEFADFILKQGYSQNTASKYYQRFKTILNEAVEKGLLQHFKHKTNKVKIQPIDTTQIFLTEEELDRMYKADIPEFLNKYRDLFLISAYTGVRYSDITQISKESFVNIEGKPHFRITDKKENSLAQIPAHPIVLDIMRRYNWKLPEAPNVKLNYYIKEVGRLAKIDQPIIVTKFPGGIRKDVQKLKYELIVSHTGRRSLITNLKIRGFDDRTIMAISGHKSDAAYKKYLKLAPSDQLNIAFRSDFFKDAKLRVIK